MNPATLNLIIQGLTAIVTVASSDQVATLVKSVKDLINTMAGCKVITAVEQKALHDYVDAIAQLAKAGVVPPHWKVEADPS